MKSCLPGFSFFNKRSVCQLLFLDLFQGTVCREIGLAGLQLPPLPPPYLLIIPPSLSLSLASSPFPLPIPLTLHTHPSTQTWAKSSTYNPLVLTGILLLFWVSIFFSNSLLTFSSQFFYLSILVLKGFLLGPYILLEPHIFITQIFLSLFFSYSLLTFSSQFFCLITLVLTWSLHFLTAQPHIFIPHLQTQNHSFSYYSP